MIYDILKVSKGIIVIIIIYLFSSKANIFFYFFKPKITIFLPIYNKGKFLERSIKSIQIQSFKNLEILPVNDGSKDDSLKVLNNLAKYDKRIRIINLRENKGTLYARAMGILNSKGEYLLNLDPDDEIIGKDSLQYLYKKGKRGNFDIIQFFILFWNKKKSQQISNFDKILYQPNAFNFGFQNNNYIDVYITNKFIRKTLIMKIYEILKEKIYSQKWIYYDDRIWSIYLRKYAKSIVFVNRTVYYYHRNEYSLMRNLGSLEDIKSKLYVCELYEKIFTKESERGIKIYIYNALVKYIKSNDLIKKIKNNINIKIMFLKIYKNFKKLIFKSQKKLNIKNLNILKYIIS